MSGETAAKARERQVREAFIDGYMSAWDSLRGSEHSQGEVREAAERAWREECVTS